MPAPKHPHRTKLMACRVCGNPITVSLYRSKPIRCPECGLDAMVTAIRQMHAKRGPYYELWRRNVARRKLGRGRVRIGD